MITIRLLHPRATVEGLGFIPGWLDEDNPAPAAEQLDVRYAHGGGWRPFGKGKIVLNADKSFSYPGDPPQHPLAEITFRRERIFMYPGDWVLILQSDGSFEISRMD